MMPLEIQQQTASPSGAVMIRAVGKPLIWKQRVTECHKAHGWSTGRAREPRLAPAAKCLTDPPQQLTKSHLLKKNTNKASVWLKEGDLQHDIK